MLTQQKHANTLWVSCHQFWRFDKCFKHAGYRIAGKFGRH